MSLKDVAASTYDRLLKLAKESGRPFNELLVYYGIERFLFRLSQSRYADNLILKGALMLHVWDRTTARATRDIDFLGKLDNSPEAIVRVIHELCATAASDGITYDPKSIAVETITENSEYQGVRVTFLGKLSTAKIPMQLDIGFGDLIHPGPESIEYPVLLKDEVPRLKGYPRETVIAEKFHAMVQFGRLNSRMKDFYDIWFLARGFDFDGVQLSEAIRKTFENRETKLSASPLPLNAEFAQTPEKQQQWAAFLKRNCLSPSPERFDKLVDEIGAFLLPLIDALAQDVAFRKDWSHSKGWT